MAADTDTGEDNRKSAEANDISLPLETFNLNHTQTSLAASAQHDLENIPSGVSKTEQIVLEARPSSGDRDRFLTWTQFWPVVVFPPTYAFHRYYRRHRPRRLPPFTPLKLPGLYGLAFASTMFSMYQTVMYIEMRSSDKRFGILEAAGDRAAALADKPRMQEQFRSLTVDADLAQAFKKLREARYRSSGIAGKLAWWDRHIWADQETFDRWTIILLQALYQKQSIAALPVEDLEICATHLANRYSWRSHKVTSALQWGFGFSIPLAMFARWSGRRALYLPMNGLQRVLIGVYLYLGMSEVFRQLWYLRKIRKRDVAARMMVDVFGSFDKETGETWIDDGDGSMDKNGS